MPAPIETGPEDRREKRALSRRCGLLSPLFAPIPILSSVKNCPHCAGALPPSPCFPMNPFTRHVSFFAPRRHPYQLPFTTHLPIPRPPHYPPRLCQMGQDPKDSGVHPFTTSGTNASPIKSGRLPHRGRRGRRADSMAVGALGPQGRICARTQFVRPASSHHAYHLMPAYLVDLRLLPPITTGGRACASVCPPW